MSASSTLIQAVIVRLSPPNNHTDPDPVAGLASRIDAAASGLVGQVYLTRVSAGMSHQVNEVRALVQQAGKLAELIWPFVSPDIRDKLLAGEEEKGE